MPLSSLKESRSKAVFLICLISLLSSQFLSKQSTADFTVFESKPLAASGVEITRPGSYTTPGTTYQLTQDISSIGSALYLGKDVTLDLNGHTISFADGDYNHIPNYGFEDGLDQWNTDKAPGAKVESTKTVHVFTGDWLLRLNKGDEIVSSPVTLPVAGRSYFAICGVAKPGMKISLYVETSYGTQISCINPADSMTTCPAEDKTVRLGGGFVVAHIHGIPAGDYRLRVRAETDCLIDHIDIRPAMDVGIGIVGETLSNMHTDDFYEWKRCAFFDESEGTVAGHTGTIPRVEGNGTITIRNGTIQSAARGVMSWGIQSTAPGCRIVLDNVRIINHGINTNAADIPFGEINNCRFEVDTPFIINRHASEHSVVMRGNSHSEIKNSVFLGGQGCLTVKGNGSTVSGCLFINRQTITNHYCVMLAADSCRVFDNRFEPDTGSGLEIYVHRHNEVFDNVFRISASPPTCEYGHEDYSVNGIRIADYRAEPGSPNACFGNKVYRNTFHIVGFDYPVPSDYIPMAYGVFHSVSGGDNYYEENVFHVDMRSPGSKAEAAACYVSGDIAGIWRNNTIITNIHAFWVGSRYGNAENGVFEYNTIIRRHDAPDNFQPVRIGFSGRGDAITKNVVFRGNNYPGGGFSTDIEGDEHEFTVTQMLTVRCNAKNGDIKTATTVEISDMSGKTVATGITGDNGVVSFELPVLRYEKANGEDSSSYSVKIGNTRKTVSLKGNRDITIICED